MDALFHIDVLYFDIFSLGMIIFLLIYVIAGAIRGFIPTLVTLLKVALIVGISILLIKPVGSLISKTVIHTSINDSFYNSLINKDAVFSTIVTAENQETLVKQGLSVLGMPDFLTKMLYGVIESYFTNLGQPLGYYFSNSFTILIDYAIALVSMLIILSIVVLLFFHFIKIHLDVSSFGIFDRILGSILLFFTGFMILEGVFFAYNLILPLNLPFEEWINKTVYLNDPDKITFSKWMIQNNWFAYWFKFSV